MVGGGTRGRGWGKCVKKMNGDRGLMRAILSLQGRQRTSEQVSRAYITKKKGVKIVQRVQRTGHLSSDQAHCSSDISALHTYSRKAVMIK